MTEETTPEAKAMPEFDLLLNLYGPVLHNEIVDRFQPVLDQVNDATNLINGCVEHSFAFGPLNFKLRTLSRRTQRALASPLLLPPRDRPSFSEVLLHRTYTLACALVEFNGRPLSLPSLDPDSVEGWIESEAIQQFMSFVENMDNSLVERMIDAQLDLELVRTYFLMYSLKNQ
jgi:hypothetical protein